MLSSDAAWHVVKIITVFFALAHAVVVEIEDSDAGQRHLLTRRTLIRSDSRQSGTSPVANLAVHWSVASMPSTEQAPTEVHCVNWADAKKYDYVPSTNAKNCEARAAKKNRKHFQISGGKCITLDTCNKAAASPAPATPAAPAAQASEAAYVLGQDNSNSCPSGSQGIATEATCQTAAIALGYTRWNGAMSKSDRPGGCYVGNDKNANWNRDVGAAASDRRLICKKAPTTAPTFPTSAPTSAPRPAPRPAARPAANGCMSTAVGGRSAGSVIGLGTRALTIEDCNDKCITTAACLAIVYRQSETKCSTLDRTYDANFAAASDDAVVSNRVACSHRRRHHAVADADARPKSKQEERQQRRQETRQEERQQQRQDVEVTAAETGDDDDDEEERTTVSHENCDNAKLWGTDESNEEKERGKRAMHIGVFNADDCSGNAQTVTHLVAYAAGGCVKNLFEGTFFCVQCVDRRLKFGVFEKNPCSGDPVVPVFPWTKEITQGPKEFEKDNCGKQCHKHGVKGFRVAWHSDISVDLCEGGLETANETATGKNGDKQQKKAPPAMVAVGALLLVCVLAGVAASCCSLTDSTAAAAKEEETKPEAKDSNKLKAKGSTKAKAKATGKGKSEATDTKALDMKAWKEQQDLKAWQEQQDEEARLHAEEDKKAKQEVDLKAWKEQQDQEQHEEEQKEEEESKESKV